VKTDHVTRKGSEVGGNKSRADREASTADSLSEYKLAACAWPSQAAILRIPTCRDSEDPEIALLAASVESSAISFCTLLFRPNKIRDSYNNKKFTNLDMSSE